MAAIGVMNFPARDIFQSSTHRMAMDPTRMTPTSYPPYSYSAYRRPSPPQAQPLPSTSAQALEPSLAVEHGHKPSLPSIANLLDIANGEYAGKQTAASAQRDLPPQEQQQLSPINNAPSRKRKLDDGESNDRVKLQRLSLPVSLGEDRTASRPILQPTSLRQSVDSIQSPPMPRSRASFSSTQPPYLPTLPSNATAPNGSHQYQQPLKRHSTTSSQISTSPYNSAPPYLHSPYTTSPTNGSNISYISPTTAYQTTPTIPAHRSIPSSYPPPSLSQQQQQLTGPTLPPPPTIPSDAAPTVHPAGNPWEHHHYISASSSATFPPSQDRYICPTCNKAFSRPSSLKIHSHSHTGEKPFKCPHLRCGKAFSVRSNMKRHERGCHAGQHGPGGPPGPPVPGVVPSSLRL